VDVTKLYDNIGLLHPSWKCDFGFAAQPLYPQGKNIMSLWYLRLERPRIGPHYVERIRNFEPTGIKKQLHSILHYAYMLPLGNGVYGN
jgi:hypothetical protein